MDKTEHRASRRRMRPGSSRTGAPRSSGSAAAKSAGSSSSRGGAGRTTSSRSPAPRAARRRTSSTTSAAGWRSGWTTVRSSPPARRHHLAAQRPRRLGRRRRAGGDRRLVRRGQLREVATEVDGLIAAARAPLNHVPQTSSGGSSGLPSPTGTRGRWTPPAAWSRPFRQIAGRQPPGFLPCSAEEAEHGSSGRHSATSKGTTCRPLNQ